MKALPLSVIIPVSKDQRIFRCIKSIDEKVEVIVILNGNYDKEIEEKLINNKNIKIFKLKEFNFSKIYNLGIKKSNYSTIFFMDSDCVFKKGALSQLYHNFGQYLIIRGRELFSYNSFIEEIVAKAREFTTSDSPNLYIPGPMFKKKVFEKVGFFNEGIYFSSDAEMAQRINSKRIRYFYMPEAQIIHDPLSIKHDLTSAFLYGVGRSQKHRILRTQKSASFIKEIYYYLVSGSRSKGILVGLYLLVWYFCFTFGFLTNNIKNKAKND